MIHYFCPKCWQDIDEEVDVCPLCKLNIREFWKSRDYVEKLIVALKHPVGSVPVQAARILAVKGDGRAVAPLIELVNDTGRDVFVTREAVEALGMIGTNEALKFLATLRDHASTVIRDEAALAIDSTLPAASHSPMAAPRFESTMPGSKITSIRALQIVDSRGYPTLRVFVHLHNGMTASSSVPASGSSAGPNEAIELRDGDQGCYAGQTVLKAVALVEQEIAQRLIGSHATHQTEIDRLLIELDGTPDKHMLGANTILGVSMAVAKAGAMASGLPLYAYLGGLDARYMPMPMMNILNGGVHADNNIDLEEFMIVPVGAPSFSEALRWGAETFHALKKVLQEKGHGTGVGDEGGFAPDLPGDPNERACELIVEAITAAGYRPGIDIAIALDVAASHFYQDGFYHLHRSGQKPRTRDDMIGFYGGLIWRFPIVSIEDGLAEHDWIGSVYQTGFFGWKVQVVGDDLYATNSQLISRGVAKGATNAVVIRLGQIGTVTEAMAAVRLCREADWGYVIAACSADTEDTFTADFAVAMGGGQIKCGSTCRGERVAKYNRLLEIEHELGPSAKFVSPMRWKPWKQAAQENLRRNL